MRDVVDTAASLSLNIQAGNVEAAERQSRAGVSSLLCREMPSLLQLPAADTGGRNRPWRETSTGLSILGGLPARTERADRQISDQRLPVKSRLL